MFLVYSAKVSKEQKAGRLAKSYHNSLSLASVVIRQWKKTTLTWISIHVMYLYASSPNWCCHKSKRICADASVGKASNTNKYFSLVSINNSYVHTVCHYILRHHNVKACSCRQAE